MTRVQREGWWKTVARKLSGNKLGKFARSRAVPVMIVLILVAAVVAVILTLPGKVSEVPSASQEGKITILENGDAQMEITTTVSMPQLNSLYREVIENDGEDAFKESYHHGIENEYKALTDLDVSITDSKIENGPNGELKISVNATAPQVGKFNSAKNLWEVDIRPPNENVAIDYILTQMMFAQMWLESQPGVQQLELVSELPIRLPSDATILNKDNLSASRWRIDFGGGMYREASLSVKEGQREVLLTERIVVTEQPPVFTQAAREGFSNYRAFTVEYNLPGVSMSSAVMSAPQAGKSNSAKIFHDWDWSWEYERSFSFSENFSENFHRESDSITADLKVDAAPSFGFTFYIGFDVDWNWTPYLDWFETYVEMYPAIIADVAADITGEFSFAEEEEDITEIPLTTVTVYIGPVPVVIEFVIDVNAGVDADAAGDFHFDAGLDESIYWKLGVRYDDGWQNISYSDENFVPREPNIEVGAEASVTAFAELKLEALLYGAAGPYVGLKPKVAINLSLNPNTWSLDAGFEIIAGIDASRLPDWVPLSSRDVTLYNWMTSPIGGTPPGSGTSPDTGTWRPNNAKPTLTRENGPPPEGTIGETFLYEVTYQDTDGDPPAYIRCFIDGVPNDMTYVSGDPATGARYRYTWTGTLDNIGHHSYYFETRDIQMTTRLPETGRYSGPTIPQWQASTAGWDHSLGLLVDNTLWAWGSNDSGKLGIGTIAEVGNYSTVPTLVSDDTNWKTFSAGYSHSLGLRSDNTLWAWGTNEWGALGLGDVKDNRLSPVQVDTATNWRAISAGAHYSLGLRSDGTLWAWGYNDFGQLGVGDTTKRTTPTQVGTENNWVEISAGDYHSLALRSDGTLWAWGSNNLGELGLGYTSLAVTSPTQVGTGNNWRTISAGGSHSLAMRSDNTLWAWGYNYYGQLGLGDTTNRTSPAQVGTENNWAVVSAGGSHSLAMRSDNTIWAWGLNFDGQLGLGAGDTTDRTSPAQVGTSTGWEAISAGSSYSLGLYWDGGLWAWGYNYSGQLGIWGTSYANPSPTPVIGPR